MRASFLFSAALVFGFAAQAFAIDCSIAVYGNPKESQAAVIEDSATIATTLPTKLRLWARARECDFDRTNICIRTTTELGSYSNLCSVSMYACPSIVRKQSDRRCRRVPSVIGTKTYPIGGRRVSFRSIVRPVALDSRKRQTQVTFQAKATCTNGTQSSTPKSSAVAVNVTCTRGQSMNSFMKELIRKTK